MGRQSGFIFVEGIFDTNYLDFIQEEKKRRGEGSANNSLFCFLGEIQRGNVYDVSSCGQY